MIINNEIMFVNISAKGKSVCRFIKLMITITTVILVIFVFCYHRLDFDLYAINNSLNHWRIGLTTTKIFLTLFEAFICMIHPMPLDFDFISNVKYDNLTISNSSSSTQITLDVALGLPSKSNNYSSYEKSNKFSIKLVFARLYLICRFLMFHSDLVRNSFSQSLGSFNQVSINFYFLLKTYIQQWPTFCLSIFCLLLFLISSWSLRACNYKSTIEHLSMFDSMWLFIVTFTTVGMSHFETFS
jgi:hypothetical protein